MLEKLRDPDVFSDQHRFRDLSRRHKQLEAIIAPFRDYRQATEDLAAAREMFNDTSGEDREYFRSEIDANERRIVELEEQLKILLLPKDPNDDKNVIVEIRGAEGGEEANLFAKDLFEM